MINKVVCTIAIELNCAQLETAKLESTKILEISTFLNFFFDNSFNGIKRWLSESLTIPLILVKNQLLSLRRTVDYCKNHKHNKTHTPPLMFETLII